MADKAELERALSNLERLKQENHRREETSRRLIRQHPGLAEHEKTELLQLCDLRSVAEDAHDYDRWRTMNGIFGQRLDELLDQIEKPDEPIQTARGH